MEPQRYACRPNNRAFGWGVAGIAALAFGVRLAYLFQIESMPFFYYPVGDAASYWQWSARITAGDWIGTEPFYQAPAYPYFLALVRLAVGDDPWRVRVVQMIMGAVACGLVALAGRWFISPAAGLCAGLMVALYGPAVFYDGLIQKAALSFLLMSLLLFLLGIQKRLEDKRRVEPPRGLKPAARERWGAFGAVGAGVVLGLLALTAEQTLLLGGVVLLWFLTLGHATPLIAPPPPEEVGHPALPPRSSLPHLQRRWATPLRRRVGQPASICTAGLVGMALPLGLVGWRNYHVGGEVSLTTFQAGPNFYIGNHDGATGRYVALKRGHESPPFERQDATELAEAALARPLTPREVSDYWWARAWNYIKAHPFPWAGLVLYKGLLVWNAYEIPDLESYTLYAHLSWLLSVCGGLNHFGVLCPLAAVGMVGTARYWRRLWGLYALAATVAVSVAVCYVLGRYRYPLVPMLAIFAGAGLCEIRRVLRALPGKRHPCEPRASGRADLPEPRHSCRAVPQSRASARADVARETGEGRNASVRSWVLALVAGVVAVGTNLRFNPERELDGMAYANLGAVLGQQERYEAARYFLEQALAQVPTSVEAHYNLGQACRFHGDYARALEHFQRAQELDPKLLGVDAQLGAVYETLGRREDAIRHYQRALTIDPRDEQARQSWERLRMENGE